MSYQVFARKYRPRTFDDVLGQDHVVRTLRNAIAQNRLAHAYLFVGPRGTGKTSTARIFAKALNCPGGPKVDFDPDNELCIEIERGIALDVREIDGASNNGVEQVRALREEVQFAPSRCRFKIYYIDEVHMLSTAAFNALLKTLEEPPAHVKFIFATTEAHKVLPTIISRCQRFDLRRIPASLIAKHLLHIASIEQVALDEKAAYAIAKGAEGGMRDAQSMLDQLVAFCGEKIGEQDVLDIFGFTQGETVARVALHMLNRDTVGALRELHTQADSGKDLSRLLGDLIQHFRTVLVHQVDATAAEEDLSPEVADMTRHQAGMIEAERLLRVMDGLAEVDSRMRWASNKLLHMELGVIQAIQTLGEVTLSEVIAALGEGEAPLASPAVKRPAPLATATPPPPAVVVERPKPAAPAPEALLPAVPPSPPVAASPAPVQELLPPPPAPAPPALSADASIGEVWQHFLDRIHHERPLVLGWLEPGALLSLEARTAKIGLPVSESTALESLLRPTMKKFLEAQFSALIGREITFDIALDPNLKSNAIELQLGLGGFDPPTPSPSPEPAATPKAEEPPPSTEADSAAAMQEFYDDPLVKSALVKFNASLVKA
ncbi:MAG: DNA polymerase III subunit gamma/tau [Roseimicrobium sp.]